MMGLWTHHMKACGFGNFRWHFIWYMWFFGLGFNGGRDYWRNRRDYFLYFTCLWVTLSLVFELFIMWDLWPCDFIIALLLFFFLSKELVIAFNWSLIKLDFFWVNWFLFIYFWLRGSMVEKWVICVIVWLEFMRVVMNIVRLDRKKHQPLYEYNSIW